jgi:hypothetical protein
MAIYSYKCLVGSHELDEYFSMGKAPDTFYCEKHEVECSRSYDNITFNNNDVYRTAYLSSKSHAAYGEQGRPMDPLAPKDKFDVVKIHEATGRKYFGNDISKINNMPPSLKEKMSK